MSKGLSRHQCFILKQLLDDERELGGRLPVAWKDLDYSPTKDESHDAKGKWNIEQALRRSLRSLEKRGLVDLRKYSFFPFAEETKKIELEDGVPVRVVVIKWCVQVPDNHVPGESRYMTGVTLTDKGRELAQTLSKSVKGVE